MSSSLRSALGMSCIHGSYVHFIVFVPYVDGGATPGGGILMLCWFVLTFMLPLYRCFPMKGGTANDTSVPFHLDAQPSWVFQGVRRARLNGVSHWEGESPRRYTMGASYMGLGASHTGSSMINWSCGGDLKSVICNGYSHAQSSS